VSDPGDVLFGRAELEQAFTALGERLARRGVVADVFVVGGAAMALAYDATRVTRDVDARFVPTRHRPRRGAPGCAGSRLASSGQRGEPQAPIKREPTANPSHREWAGDACRALPECRIQRP
jgi:hypothetical protein